MAKIADKMVDVARRAVVFSFVNGETVTARLDDLPQEMRDRLALHGMSQKGGDAYASAGDKDMSVADCADAVRSIVGNLQAGVWSAGRTAGPGGAVAEALMRLTGRSAEEVAEVLASMSKEGLAELKRRPDMKAELARIAAERAEAKARATAGGAGTGDDLGALFG